MKPWKACVAALALVSLGGCMRGCGVGPPAKQCKDSSECDDLLSCYRGYCSSQSYIDADKKCRAGPACLEFGACGAVTVESFLGANKNLECAAIDEADCRASHACTERGACALSDVYCVASSDEACKKSTRCETHEECTLSKRACVRPWRECVTADPLPNQPAWASAETFDVDMKRLGGKTSPGPVRGAVIACEVEAKRRWSSRVVIRDRCTPGPVFGAGDDRLTFARANVSLDPGDGVTVIVQKEGVEAGADDSSFVRAIYQGESPFKGGEPGESLSCHIVPSDAARTFGLELLGTVKKNVKLAKPHKPSRDRLQDLPDPLWEARRGTSYAALWMGWDAPEVKEQLEAMAKVERGWSRALETIFRDLEKKAPPLSDLVTLKGHRPASIKPHALVCGEALRARYGDRAKGRTIGPADCGLELVMSNEGDTEVTYSWSFSSIGPIDLQRWLVRSEGAAHVLEAVMVDARLDTPGSKPETALHVAPGKRAIVLVGGKQRDPKLGRGNVEEHTLFQGYVSFGDWFELRTDLER